MGSSRRKGHTHDIEFLTDQSLRQSLDPLDVLNFTRQRVGTLLCSFDGTFGERVGGLRDRLLGRHIAEDERSVHIEMKHDVVGTHTIPCGVVAHSPCHCGAQNVHLFHAR